MVLVYTDSGVLFATGFGKEGGRMAIRSLSEDIFLIILPRQPQPEGDLEVFMEIVKGGYHCSAIVDFSKVRSVCPEVIGRLMELNKLLGGLNRRQIDFGAHPLVLCGVCRSVREEFERMGVDTLFEFSGGLDSGLAFIERARRRARPAGVGRCVCAGH